MVEVCAPCVDEIAGMVQVVEEVFVEAFVSHAAIEAFDKAILNGSPGAM